MKYTLSILNWLQTNTDKLAHGFIGVAIGAIVLFIASLFTGSILMYITAFIIVVILAFGKEIDDAIRREKVFSWYDMLATVIGGLLIIVYTLIVK